MSSRTARVDIPIVIAEDAPELAAVLSGYDDVIVTKGAGAAAWLRDLIQAHLDVASSNEEVNRLTEELAQARHQAVASRARVDPATDLWDREHLIERLEDESNRVARYKVSFGAVLVELLAPNLALEAAVGELLRGFVRKVDVCVRYAPSTFVVVCPNTDEAGMRHFGTRVIDAVARANLPGFGPGLRPPLAVATVTLASGPVPADEILVRLDEALHAARASHGVVHWSESLRHDRAR